MLSINLAIKSATLVWISSIDCSSCLSVVRVTFIEFCVFWTFLQSPMDTQIKLIFRKFLKNGEPSFGKNRLNIRIFIIFENWSCLFPSHGVFIKMILKYRRSGTFLAKLERENLHLVTDFWNWWFAILAFHFLWWAFFLSISAFNGAFWLSSFAIENIVVTNTKVFVQIVDAAPSVTSWWRIIGLDFTATDSWSRATSVSEQCNRVCLNKSGFS